MQIRYGLGRIQNRTTAHGDDRLRAQTFAFFQRGANAGVGRVGRQVSDDAHLGLGQMGQNLGPHQVFQHVDDEDDRAFDAKLGEPAQRGCKTVFTPKHGFLRQGNKVAHRLFLSRDVSVRKGQTGG